MLTKFVLTVSQKQKIKKMAKSIFYHAGCPVCVSAEQDIISLIGESDVEVVHLVEDISRINY